MSAPLLAACGSSAGGTSGGSAGTGGASSSELLSILGISKSETAGGTSIPMGAVLPLTGPGSFYGKVQGNGLKLAVAHIRAAGGPDLQANYQDNQSGNAQAGVSAVRQLGAAGVQACLSSYVGDIGAMLPGVAQYKMLTLDGGGGTSDFAQGKPYFWGMKAIEPDDYYIGAVKYWQAKNPGVKRVYLVALDQGKINTVVRANFVKALATASMTLAGFEATPIGTTDFSTTITHLKAANPDAVFTFLVGLDSGYFMKDFVAAGLSLPVIGAEYTTDALKVSAGAYDHFMFSTDWFDPKTQVNPLARYFVKAYVKAYGQQPDYYAANYYEDTLALWDLIRRVKAKGADPNNGTTLQDALIASPVFKSVYGGTSSTVGTLSLNRTTHSVATRPLNVLKCHGNSVIAVATFQLGGADFKLT
jgi:branched-chain amino acid transport system substrate-binding protein